MGLISARIEEKALFQPLHKTNQISYKNVTLQQFYSSKVLQYFRACEFYTNNKNMFLKSSITLNMKKYSQIWISHIFVSYCDVSHIFST